MSNAVHPTAAHPTAAMVADFSSRGPVLLLVDGSADGLRDLPAEARDRVVILELAGPLAESALQGADGERLLVPFGLADGDNAVAVVPWEAVFSVSGRTPDGQMTTRTRLDRVPGFLGSDGHLSMRWLMLHLGLGDPPAQPTEWRIGISPEMLRDDSPRDGFEPDPRAALERCFAQVPPAAALLLDVSDPGLSLPDAWPRLDGGACQLMVTPLAPLLDVRLDEHGVRWRAPLQDAQRDLGVHAFFVPWGAIGAMQHPASDLGWFWPLQLPLGMRQPMLDHPDLAPHLRWLQGAPLAPRPQPPAEPPPMLLLAAPNDLPKPDALQDCDARGGGIVLLDARQLGVRLSEGLRGAGLLAVPFGMQGLASTIDYDAGGIDAELPGFLGQPSTLSAPWRAVFAIATNQGAMRVHCWPDDYPDEITMALSLLQHMADNDGDITVPVEGLPITLGDGAPEPDARGTAVGLGRDESGQYVLQLRQQCGEPQPNGDTPEMRVEFCLRMRAMH